MNKPNTARQSSKDICTIIEQATTILRSQPNIAAAYLLGSATTGQLRDDSDIDIALLPTEQHTISMQSRLELAALLEIRLGRTIDIGIINSENLIYASEAILNGQRILTSKKDYTAETETRLMGCYLVFKEDRKEVEEMYSAA